MINFYGQHLAYEGQSKPLFRVRDIFVTDPDPFLWLTDRDPALFVSDLQDAKKKKSSFFAYYGTFEDTFSSFLILQR